MMDKPKKPRLVTKNQNVIHVRNIENGDISPDLTENGIESYEVNQAIEAAQVSKATALQDILTNIKSGDAKNLAQTLNVILEGASPEDAAKLRQQLLKQMPVVSKKRVDPDEELSKDWREGGYPYKNLDVS